MTDYDPQHETPICVGSTFNLYQGSLTESAKREATKLGQGALNHTSNSDNDSDSNAETNYFKSAQWSPDGTCILTNSEDNHLRTFVLPVDLLESHVPHDLSPYSILPSAEPVYNAALYPGFNLQDPSTTLYLSSPRGHPIRLTSALYPSLLASYFLISPTTEKYITPHSLIWTRSGTHFITGSDSLISVFDISRSGSEPMERHATIPSKRKKIVGGGVGMKGIVSCLDISSWGILAAGTFTRNVGLYDSQGSGDCIAVFSAEDSTEHGIGGAGVTQVIWSSCGTYLYVVERKSHGILVYDIRVTGKKIGCLTGRRADTNQRLSVDVVPIDRVNEVWAGGLDGVVRIWEHGGAMEGMRDPTREWKAHNDSATSTVVHPSGSVVATCSGQRHGQLGHGKPNAEPVSSDLGEDSDSDTSSSNFSASDTDMEPDNSLKIWRL